MPPHAQVGLKSHDFRSWIATLTRASNAGAAPRSPSPPPTSRLKSTGTRCSVNVWIVRTRGIHVWSGHGQPNDEPPLRTPCRGGGDVSHTGTMCVPSPIGSSVAWKGLPSMVPASFTALRVAKKSPEARMTTQVQPLFGSVVIDAVNVSSMSSGVLRCGHGRSLADRLSAPEFPAFGCELLSESTVMRRSACCSGR